MSRQHDSPTAVTVRLMDGPNGGTELWRQIYSVPVPDLVAPEKKPKK